MKLKNSYYVIGLMSGTSLDGLDMAYCNLVFKNKKWKAEIIAATTLKYNVTWKKKLSTAQLLSGEELIALHAEYGIYIGQCCNDFIKKQKIKTLDFIASHGHTIFHQPQRNFTFQLGDGNQIHSLTNVPVVYDFRSLDVANGGEGAPLVPVGDRYLFADFDICLNLGGIANLSIETKGNRKAFDICFANMGLNYLMGKLDKEFDTSGGLTSTGEVNEKLLKELRGAYRPLRKKRPSLGREGFEQWIQKILDNDQLSVPDRLRTFSESIVEEIYLAIPSSSRKLKMIATGGGALNIFFMLLLAHRVKSKVSIIVPDRKIIEFKEALVFALLGVLRVRNEVNALKSVTGARKDSSSGVIIGF